MLELKQEIISFLELLERADDFPELSDTDSLCDLAFAVVILTHMKREASFILKANVQHAFCSFPHTGNTERVPSTH